MPIVRVGEWLPDQPDFENPGSALVQNVVPKTLQSYGPFGSFTHQLNALAKRCQGAIGVKDKNGFTHAFAGTIDKLYHVGGGGIAWSDVSNGTYAVENEEYWSFAQFGDQMVATQFTNTPQIYTMGVSSVFADIQAPTGNNGIAPPKAKYACVAKDFMLYGFTQDPTDGLRNQRVWWPAINTATDFYLPGTAEAIEFQSDFQDVVGDHGDLTGIVANIGPVDAAVFFQRAVFRMMYAGSPDIWNFFPAHGARGCIAPQTLRVTEFGAIYLAGDGFYMYDGEQSTPIGHLKVDKFFYNNVNQGSLHHCHATVDPINKLYIVAFPSKNAPDGVCDQMLVCAYALPSITGTPGRWSYITGLNSEFLFKSMSFGYTLDQMDVFGVLDSIQDSLDSRVWTGDKEILTAFDDSHFMCYFLGPNLAPLVETTEAQLIPNRRSYVTNTIPLVDNDTPSISAGSRNRLEDPVVYTSHDQMQANGFSPLRSYGRYHRFRISMESGSEFSNIQGVDIPDEALTEAGMR